MLGCYHRAIFLHPNVLVFLILLFTRSLAAHQPEENNGWPRWRGHNMDATVAKSGMFEGSERYRLEVVWRRALGSGYSAVSVSKRAAVTMFSLDHFDFVVALDADNGNELWRYRIDSTFVGRFGSQNGPISTAIVSDDTVFGLGPRGDLFALDLHSGSEIWRCNLVKDYQARAPFYGFATSAILHGNLLIVQMGGTDQRAIAAFDAMTGEVVWTAGADNINYQSPVLTNVNGVEQLICVGQEHLYGLQPMTGAVLWEYRHRGAGGALGVGCANPVMLPENQLLLTYNSGESILLRVNPAESEAAVRESWKTKDLKKSYTIPVYWDGHLYGYNATFLTCVDASTGKALWKSREPGDGFPVIVDGHLVTLTKTGTLSVAKASPEGYTEIASLDLFDHLTWCLPAIAGSKIYARSHQEVACVKVVPAGQATAAMSAQQGVIPGSKFADFIERLSQAPNKKKLIDDFMARQTSFPIIEGNDIAHFVYRGDAKEMALTGELIGMETEQFMNRVPETDLFYYSVHLPSDARICYGFLKDMQEEMLDPMNDEKSQPMWSGDLSVLTMPDWQSSDHVGATESVPKGRIEGLPFHSSQFEKADTLRVYLPYGYDESAGSFPVVYFHGTIGESGLPASLNYLIDRTVKPVIVVFIPPFSRGGYGTYIGGFRDTYADVFVSEIVPLIDQKYRTIADASGRANAGAFWGGFMAFYSTFKNPGVFGKLAMHSPYWDPKEESKHAAQIATFEPTLDIYCDWGKYDPKAPLEGWDFSEYARSFSRLLKENGHSLVGREYNDGAGWANWSQRTDKMFEALFPIISDDRN